MRFTEVEIPGIFLLDIEPHADDRGFFARTFCRAEFTRRGLEHDIEQWSVSYNPRRGTLRGMHWQDSPNEEAKLVRCVRGSVFDVAVDLRPGSPTRLQWISAELTAENRRSLYIPPGCAHGFMTIEDGSELLYGISAAYHPASSRGFRYDDPAVGIHWPNQPSVISGTDLSYPPLLH